MTLRNAALGLLASILMLLAGFVGSLVAPVEPAPVLPVVAPVSAPAYYPGPEVTTPVVAPDAPVGAPDALEAAGDGSGPALAPASTTEAAPVDASTGVSAAPDGKSQEFPSDSAHPAVL